MKEFVMNVTVVLGLRAEGCANLMKYVSRMPTFGERSVFISDTFPWMPSSTVSRVASGDINLVFTDGPNGKLLIETEDEEEKHARFMHHLEGGE